ncbi:auxin-induced in root cultures protein 12-like [Diospyros lotus]|uniref:auxin-induced in root cultures protein 12-like n=1 Tax=Diospyros lotus TaxID=55363 RepID=UPI00225142C0|nr:auxin-induced in root cultures protein 12-like [Diospyros lotus]
MASPQRERITALILLLASVPLLISPAKALNCTSQNFTNKMLYDKCVDLPTLSAYLHWNYNGSKLSIAFVAPPASPTGWISWAINPTGTGMLGSQALIAFKHSNGSVAVDTYNISAYKFVQSKIAFDVPDKKAESSGGVMRIFATLELPNGMTLVNQVWQVGSSVTDNDPVRHDLQPANLKSNGTINLVTGTQNASAPAPSPAGTNSGSGPSGDNGGASVTISGGAGLALFNVLLLGSFLAL